MGLLLRSLAMLTSLSLIWFSWLPNLSSAQSGQSARALDALLQDYAYRAFVRPKTGVPYNGTVPTNLTGISVSALRLRSGSLFRRGANYSEFEIRRGLSVTPYVERLVLVYQNLGNWSLTYYPLQGYTYLAPVLGLLAYDASNLSARNLPELDLRASGDPILIRFGPGGGAPGAKCVRFGLDGSPSFSELVSGGGGVCSTAERGHFSIVVQSAGPAPAPGPGAVAEGGGGHNNNNNRKLWVVLGSVAGGVVALGLLAVLAVWCLGFKKRKRMERMERAAEAGEALHMTSVGTTRAPAATVTRTQPVLESEYVP